MPYVANFQIDANPVTDVSGIRVDFEDAPAQTTGDGGEVTSRRTKGAKIAVTFGTEGIKSAGFDAALRALRGDVIPHTLTFDDPDGEPWTFDVNWKAKPPLHIGVAGIFESVTIIFTERP
jgi:hypothetical protein